MWSSEWWIFNKPVQKLRAIDKRIIPFHQAVEHTCNDPFELSIAKLLISLVVILILIVMIHTYLGKYYICCSSNTFYGLK